MRRGRSGDGEPRQRLLKAGEELFALQGYHDTTIRDICQRANVNVAMITYYFGGKEPLYRAVLEYSINRSLQRNVSVVQADKIPPDGQLRGFVRGLLSHALEEGGTSWSGRLLLREMMSPTVALDIVVDKVIRPRAERAKALVRALAGPAASGEDLIWYEQSVAAQCLHYRHNRPILDRLHPWLPRTFEHLDMLAEHIAQFSLSALRAFRDHTKGHRAGSSWAAVPELNHSLLSRSITRRHPQPPATGPHDRLMNAGETLFALVGYRRATVREISQRADVNVAMVNYYFGGKEQLYQAVLEHALHESVARYVDAFRHPDNATPEQRLHAFVTALLLHVLDENGGAPIGQLMSREMAEPTFALDSVVDKIIRPRSEELISIVRAFLGPSASRQTVVLCEQSIVAQCLHYRHNRAVTDRLFPSLQYGPADITRLAWHITRFSLGALKSLEKPATESP
jgi:AcrR family transcriptional regulator